MISTASSTNISFLRIPLPRTPSFCVVAALAISLLPLSHALAGTGKRASAPAVVASASSHNDALGHRYWIAIASQQPKPSPTQLPGGQESVTEAPPPEKQAAPESESEWKLDGEPDKGLHWYFSQDHGFRVAPDSNILSRLWWQSNPLEVVSSSSGSYLGIGVADVTKQMAEKLNLSEVRGVVVTAVAEGSPAQKAGLKVKDVLISYNGNRLEGRQQLTRMVAETPGERTVTVAILRNGSPQEIRLTTAPRRMNPELKIVRPASVGRNMFILPDLPRMISIYRSPMLGIESETLNTQLANFFGVKDGVLVREVIPESPAAKAGVKAGDIVVELAGEAISNPSDIGSVLRAKGSQGDPLTMVVVRNQKKMQVTILPSGEWTEGRYFRDDPVDTWSRK